MPTDVKLQNMGKNPIAVWIPTHVGVSREVQDTGANAEKPPHRREPEGKNHKVCCHPTGEAGWRRESPPLTCFLGGEETSLSDVWFWKARGRQGRREGNDRGMTPPTPSMHHQWVPSPNFLCLPKCPTPEHPSRQISLLFEQFYFLPKCTQAKDASPPHVSNQSVPGSGPSCTLSIYSEILYLPGASL